MKLIIKDDKVIATHDNSEDVKDLYPGCEVIWIANHIELSKGCEFVDNGDISELVALPTDPRTGWKLAEHQKNAIDVIEDIAEEYRVKSLSMMPGRIASYQAKAVLARKIISTKDPDPQDISYFELEASNRKITVLELAKIIVKKATEFTDISTYIDGEIVKTKAAIRKSKSDKNIWKLLKDFELNIINKIS